MKTLLTLLLLSVVPIAAMGCGRIESGTSAPPNQTTINSSDETPQICIGRTNLQFPRAWGDLSGRDVGGQGETWVWGGQNWKRQIPYGGPFMKVQTSKVLFGPDGLVKDFRLTDKGDMMSDMEGHSGGFNPW